MREDCRELIQEWFADCSSVEEVAELYADIKMENQKQMEYMMQTLTKKDEE
jgi:hypothetical protein